MDDTPLTLKVGTTEWSPRNYENRYEGRVTVRRALERSLNAATVRVAMEVGLPAVIEMARDFRNPGPARRRAGHGPRRLRSDPARVGAGLSAARERGCPPPEFVRGDRGVRDERHPLRP